MAVEIVMPRFGWSMEEGILVEWLKRDGESVKAGDILFTVESDKALNEVESFENGILRILPGSPGPGSTVQVGTLLAYLVRPGEDAPFEAEIEGDNVEDEALVAGLAVVPAGAEERQERTRRTISPRARRIAAELGIGWDKISGSGSSGRIVERDIRAAADRQASEVAGAIPISGTRRTIAQRMVTSAQIPAVTLTSEVDASELVRLRSQLKNDPANRGQQVPSYTVLLVKIVAHALAEHPQLNARLEGERIVGQDAVHIGIATDSERGLLVPVLRDAGSKSLRQLTREAEELVEHARSGKLGSAHMQGSTFTVTNLGMYEIDAFTPLINPPECAILGLGRIVPRPVIVDLESERIAVRQMMVLSLSFDHRLVDGAPAARFLQRVKQLAEQPYLWLVT